MQLNAAKTHSTCSKCSYNLTGLRAGDPCPECGLIPSLLFETPTWSLRRCRCARAGALLLIGWVLLCMPAAIALSSEEVIRLPVRHAPLIWFTVHCVAALGAVLLSAAVFGSYERLFTSTIWPVVLMMMLAVTAGLWAQGESDRLLVPISVGLAASVLCAELSSLRFGKIAGQLAVEHSALRALKGLGLLAVLTAFSFLLGPYFLGGLIPLLALAWAIVSLLVMVPALWHLYWAVPELKR